MKTMLALESPRIARGLFYHSRDAFPCRTGAVNYKLLKHLEMCPRTFPNWDGNYTHESGVVRSEAAFDGLDYELATFWSSTTGEFHHRLARKGLTTVVIDAI